MIICFFFFTVGNYIIFFMLNHPGIANVLLRIATECPTENSPVKWKLPLAAALSLRHLSSHQNAPLPQPLPQGALLLTLQDSVNIARRP